MTGIILFVLILAGWLLGTLINYLADVLPKYRKLSPVECSSCLSRMKVWDYLVLKPCYQCHTARTTRAWVVNISAMTLVIAQWFFPMPRLGFWIGILLLTYFGVVAVIDIEHRLILHPVSAVGGVICLGIGFWTRGGIPTMLGGLAGFLLMLGIYLLGWLVMKAIGRIRGEKIEEDALGFGDIILCTVLGFLIGWPGVALEVLFTIFIAGIFSLFILILQVLQKRYQMFSAVAFGPYLLLAALILLYLRR